MKRRRKQPFDPPRQPDRQPSLPSPSFLKTIPSPSSTTTLRPTCLLRLPTPRTSITSTTTSSTSSTSSWTLRLGFSTTSTPFPTPAPRTLPRQSRTPAPARSPRAATAVAETAAPAALAGPAGVETGVVGRGRRGGFVDARGGRRRRRGVVGL